MIILFGTMSSCKKETKLPEYNIEELKKRELDSVKSLLSLSRVLIKKEDYENAIVNLDVLINNYATYQEVIEAQRLKDKILIKLLIKKINEENSIQNIIILVTNVIDPEILNLASERILQLIDESKSIAEIEDFLDSNEFMEHRNSAKNKLTQLKEDYMEDAYENALASESSSAWKKFLNDYPNHVDKEKINTLIIKLEVDEIFDGEYGDIPSSQLLGERNNEKSSIDIKNDTKYTLTLRYSGEEVKKLIILPRETKTVNLRSGDYRVTASVNASNVRNFAGKESLYGEYSSSYYISTSSN